MAETGPSVLEAARAATREEARSERRETAGSGVGSEVGEGIVVGNCEMRVDGIVRVVN